MSVCTCPLLCRNCSWHLYKQEFKHGPFRASGFLKNEACSAKVNDNQCVKCIECDNLHHAVCPSGQKDDQICNQTFLTNFLKSSTKQNFTWSCDSCKTQDESNKVATLRQMLTKMEKSHSDQIAALTTLIQALT